jgi:hypothetical protein
MMWIAGAMSLFFGIAATQGWRSVAWERFHLPISPWLVVIGAIPGLVTLVFALRLSERTILRRDVFFSWLPIGAMFLAALTSMVAYSYFEREENRRASLTPPRPALKSPSN